MSFHIAGSDLYVVSDLPLKDARRERQFVDQHTVILPAAALRYYARQQVKLKDGSTVIWQDLMLMCIKDKTLLWSRFVSNAPVGYAPREGAGGLVHIRPGTHDVKTGQLLQIGKIEIGEK